ncbi:uncharacterized protein CLUP02_03742 [Colletotrichum lupini]|uniref:Uncharacterized protein n=1 Tax=Colletotrichum lupini TaxID=145971 RepID=A0A9Q8SJW9_9PEZI|nr:uncharacterized protein CLUP02_03742 [Colletotrichum lupini]UQC78265.1 hypothetical protein CLUP02_03742 [Colletotrichum lupini]
MLLGLSGRSSGANWGACPVGLQVPRQMRPPAERPALGTGFDIAIHRQHHQPHLPSTTVSSVVKLLSFPVYG